MRKQNANKAVPLDAVPERRTERCYPKIRPVIAFVRNCLFIVSISSTKSAIFDIFASLHIDFAKCLKMAISHTFEIRVVLLPINSFLSLSSMQYI